MMAAQGRRTLAHLAGVVLGLAGALLDFASGYLLMTQGGMARANMVWGVGIFALGLVLAATALASVYLAGAGQMGGFGALMILYGLVMLFIGGVMLSGVVSMMTGALLSGTGMVLVGILMIVNGLAMRRSRMM